MPSLWNTAQQKLSIEDQALFDTNGDDKRKILEEILGAVRKQQADALHKRWKVQNMYGKHVFLRDVCGKVLRWVKEFMSVVDVAVSFDPVHTALPWAGIRFLLQVRAEFHEPQFSSNMSQLSLNDADMFDHLIDGLEIVVRVVARYTIFEEIYFSSVSKARKHLEEQLVNLYAAVLRYLCKARRYYSHHTASRCFSIHAVPIINLCSSHDRDCSAPS